VEVAAAAGTFGTRGSRLTYGAKSASGIEWLLSGSHYQSDGADTLYFSEFDQRISDDPRASHDGLAHERDGEEAASLFGKLRYGSLTLSAFAADRTKDVPTASFETLFNGREWTEDQRQYVDLKYDRAFNDGIKLQARGFYDRASYRGNYPYDYAEPGDPPDIVVSKDHTDGEWLGSEWQLTMPVLARHRLILGGEYRESLHEDQYVYDEVEPREYHLYDERSSRTYGVFAQGDAVLSDELTLSAGLRFDNYAAAELDVVNPRLALIYSPSPRSAFKVLYGEAFRAPNPYEHYYTDTEESHVKPALEPETISTYELVYEQYLGLNYRVNVSAYSYRVDDLISQAATDDEVLYFDNLDSVRAHGLELEVEGKFDSGALARASYAVQRAKDGTTDAEISSSPRHLGKLNLSLPLYKDRLSAGLELQYHGRVTTLDDRTVDDFVVANVTLLSQHVFKGLELSASLYNVFDTRYGYPGAEDHLQSVIEQNGRMVRVKAAYEF
jgi:iron complex outermembrane receptor protein